MPRPLLLALAALMAPVFQQQTFKTGVDLVAVDVTVVDRNGTPVENLTAADFEVWIAGRPRKVVEIVRMSYGSSAPASSPAPGTGGDRAPTPPH